MERAEVDEGVADDSEPVDEVSAAAVAPATLCNSNRQY